MTNTNLPHDLNILDVKVGGNVTWKTNKGWKAQGKVEDIDYDTQTLQVSKDVRDSHNKMIKSKWYPVKFDKILSIGD